MARGGGGGNFPVAPQPQNPNPQGPGGGNPPSTGSPSTGSPSTGSPSGGGGGGRSMNPYARAQARADAKEREYKRKAANKYLQEARTIGLQIAAMKKVLGPGGFKAALDQQLKNINITLRGQDQILRKDYQTRYGSLENAASDNEKAAGAGGYMNLTNAGRERANAISEAMAQGAGETDLLRAQAMSLRSWNANQSELNRSFFDTTTSINSSLNDLTADVRTGRANLATEANADRNQQWTNYFDRSSETLTNLGNAYGAQALALSNAYEQVASKKTKKRMKRSQNRSGESFEEASDFGGKAWKNPGVPKRLLNWEGKPDFEGRLNNNVFSSAATELVSTRPEGAHLREWEQ